MSSTAFNRIVDPAYADGQGIPRGGWESAVEGGTSTGGGGPNPPCNRGADVLLPNPRKVSTVLHPAQSNPSTKVRNRGCGLTLSHLSCIESKSTNILTFLFCQNRIHSEFK